MHICKHGGCCRVLATTRDLSDVGGKVILIFLMTYQAGTTTYSGGGGGRQEKGSWHKYLGSKIKRVLKKKDEVDTTLIRAKILYLMFDRFVYAFSGFRAHEFTAKSEKNWDIFF